MKTEGMCSQTAAVAASAIKDEASVGVEVTPATQGAQWTYDRQNTNATCIPASKDKRRSPLRLDMQQEELVFEFVEAHQELYNKGHPNFLKTEHKQELWQQLADILKVTDSDDSIANGPRVMTWWITQRSAYGKVTRTVSGKRSKQLSAREQRLKERLGFLSGHVYRVPNRTRFRPNLMSRHRGKHSDNFDIPPQAAQCTPPHESGIESEYKQTTLALGRLTEGLVSIRRTKELPSPAPGRGSRLLFLRRRSRRDLSPTSSRRPRLPSRTTFERLSVTWWVCQRQRWTMRPLRGFRLMSPLYW